MGHIELNIPVIAQLIFVPPYEKKFGFIRRRKLWTFYAEINNCWEMKGPPPFCGFDFFLDFITHFIKLNYGVSLEKKEIKLSNGEVFYREDKDLYRKFLITTFKEKNEDIYHPIIDLIFSHMEEVYVQKGEDPESPSTFFIRVEDNFFVRNLYLAEKNLENYADTITKKFDNDVYKRIITNVKNTVKRWDKEIEKRIDKEGKYNKKEKKRYSSPEADARSIDNCFMLRDFYDTVIISNVFPIIPNTLDCNLVDQLFVFYSELLKEFLVYAKECKSYTEKEKECTLNYLQGMKDFFYVKKAEIKQA